jgi:hypothetical protein
MNHKFKTMAILSAIVLFAACKKGEEIADIQSFTKTGFSTNAACNCTITTTDTLPQIINSNITLNCNTRYILKQKTYVTNNAVLTINPGTRIEGLFNSDANLASALIITRGSRIEAAGTADCPIVFTSVTANGGSPQPGDWGGVVLLGKAPVNQSNPAIEGINPPTVPPGVDYNYGGSDICDNSGTLTYVRIEYAGAAIAPDNELNALTLGGIGSGTTIHHVQAYYGADDGFEFFGGTVNAKYLLAVANNDDQFDFDFGYNGRIQYAVSILDAAATYSANSNGIECDNEGASPYTAIPNTKPVLSNFTIIGVPNCTVPPEKGKLLYGAHFRREAAFDLRNSIIAGYSIGIYMQAPFKATSCDSTRVCDLTVSGLFDNIAQACNTGYSPSNPCPSNIYVGTNPSSIGLASLFPFNWSQFFSNALSPASSPANTSPDYLGLLNLTCGCTSGVNGNFLQGSKKGGAIDEYGTYWISANWVNKAKRF